MFILEKEKCNIDTSDGYENNCQVSLKAEKCCIHCINNSKTEHIFNVFSFCTMAHQHINVVIVRQHKNQDYCLTTSWESI